MSDDSTAQRPTLRTGAFASIRTAAAALDCTEGALRARCRRSARRDQDGALVAMLGRGVIAIKLGAHWRVTVPEERK